jgi:hypothetical protein
MFARLAHGHGDGRGCQVSIASSVRTLEASRLQQGHESFKL